MYDVPILAAFKTKSNINTLSYILYKMYPDFKNRIWWWWIRHPLNLGNAVNTLYAIEFEASPFCRGSLVP
jgi:hypothetical protein